MNLRQSGRPVFFCLSVVLALEGNMTFMISSVSGLTVMECVNTLPLRAEGVGKALSTGSAGNLHLALASLFDRLFCFSLDVDSEVG